MKKILAAVLVLAFCFSLSADTKGVRDIFAEAAGHLYGLARNVERYENGFLSYEKIKKLMEQTESSLKSLIDKAYEIDKEDATHLSWYVNIAYSELKDKVSNHKFFEELLK